MPNQSLLIGKPKNFENIKYLDENGVGFWFGRELMHLLAYNRRENFELVIWKAQQACFGSNQDVDNHFRDASNIVKIGSSKVRNVDHWKLDRCAGYLIAQNGDSRKPEIALAQTYFVVLIPKLRAVWHMVIRTIMLIVASEAWTVSLVFCPPGLPPQLPIKFASVLLGCFGRR
jgi:hypothetical protein